MISQKFIDTIEDLRHNTYSRITRVQKDLCPMVKHIYLNYQFEYWYDGMKYVLWEDDTHLYAVNEVPYCYDNNLKNTVFMDTLDNLVAEDKVWPFLMFINGEAIPWSHITVIHDYDYSYLKIKDYGPDYSDYVDIIQFPLPSKRIRYGEDNDILIGVDDRKGFYFDKNGCRIENLDLADVAIRLEILDENIYYKEIKIDTLEDKLVFTDLPDGFIPTLDNVILFDAMGKFFHDGPSACFDNPYDSAYNTFRIINKETTAKWIILMYNTRHTKSKSYLYDRAEDLDRKSIVKLLDEHSPEENSPEWSDIIHPLLDKFDFDHAWDVDYLKNLEESAKYITNYDFRLWKDTFLQGCQIKSYTYTGAEFKNLADGKGYMHWSRYHGEMIEDVVMMFVNNILYPYSIDITYTNNTINMPIFGIKDDDHVEVLMFKRCNNNILDIVVPNSYTSVYIPPEYDIEDCFLMSEECIDAEYDIPNDDSRAQYDVEYYYSPLYIIDGYVLDNKLYFDMDKEYVIDTTLIIPAAGKSNNYYLHLLKDYYYGKKLKLVPKNQFRFYEAKQKAGEHRVILPTTFNYCHDPDRYLIFVNGKKIDRTEYTITFPAKDRPFDRLVLYLSTILEEGDYVDIFSVPEKMIEKYKELEMTEKGLIKLTEPNNYPKLYPLSKYTSLVFVNGLKVNPMEIKDIDLNSILVYVDKYKRDEDDNIIVDEDGNPVTNPYHVNSIYNVTLMEFLNGDKEVAGFLQGLYDQIPEGEPYDPDTIDFTHKASDNWKNLIETIYTKYDGNLDLIYGKIHEIEDIEENYKNNFGTLKSILYDVVVDYYLDGEATTGRPFAYDFERQVWEPYNENPNIVKNISLYPDKDKMLNYHLTDASANPEDVLSGEKFLPTGE